jgi:hypothetical protein
MNFRDAFPAAAIESYEPHGFCVYRGALSFDQARGLDADCQRVFGLQVDFVTPAKAVGHVGQEDKVVFRALLARRVREVPLPTMLHLVGALVRLHEPDGMLTVNRQQPGATGKPHCDSELAEGASSVIFHPSEGEFLYYPKGSFGYASPESVPIDPGDVVELWDKDVYHMGHNPGGIVRYNANCWQKAADLRFNPGA